MTGLSYRASNFIVMAPGRTLLETDTLLPFFTFVPRQVILFIQLLIKTRFSDRRTACCLLHYRSDSVQRMRITISRPHAFWSGRHFEADVRHVTFISPNFRFSNEKSPIMI